LKRLQGVVDGELIEEAVQLNDIWNALLCMGAADRIVAEMVSQFWLYLCVPLWTLRRVTPAEVLITLSEATITFETLIVEQTQTIDVCRHL
jgi:hypothetical protein